MLTGRSPDVIEIRWLLMMDDKWLHTISVEKRAKQEREKEAAKRKAGK